MHLGSARTPASPCPQENLNIMLHLRAVWRYPFQETRQRQVCRFGCCRLSPCFYLPARRILFRR